jgi:hypothetical protein
MMIRICVYWKKVIIGYELIYFSMNHFSWPITKKIWNMGGYCWGHKKTQEQILKERFKSNFQTRNKTRLHNSKNKNIITQNKNTKCARQM